MRARAGESSSVRLSTRPPYLASLIGACALMVSGCAATVVHTGIGDASLAQRAVVPGFAHARFWGDHVPGDFLSEMRKRLPNQRRMSHGDTKTRAGRPIVDILALSGGGGDGAFGAGLLSGWSDHGSRPRFEVVTGVSAGAIIAPFAFLGPSEDDKLRRIWTQYRTSQIATAMFLPGLLGGSALADTSPMRALIAEYVTPSLLRRIAHEYQNGRLLLVGTTNIDAQRPVIWNMGEIATIGGKQGLKLFRDVIMASAAIPGAFPPVKIDVKVDGKRYSELHVDGGTTRELFVGPISLPLSEYDRVYDRKPLRRIFIIKNGKVSPEQDSVQPQTISLAARAITTLIKNQSLGDTYRLYRMTRDDGGKFHFAAVPASFEVKADEFFDPDYQRALYEEGYRLGRAGGEWLNRPPDTLGE